MKTMKTLTVFTPTFNRAECLRRCYESLLRQTCRDFVWLVIDDGSSDGTADLVREWQRAGHLEIRYHYQENGGMHTAHNAAYGLMDTELNVSLATDDLMTEDAVATILKLWKRRGIARMAGITLRTGAVCVVRLFAGFRSLCGGGLGGQEARVPDRADEAAAALSRVSR